MKRLVILVLLIGGIYGFSKLNERDLLHNYTLETFAAEQSKLTDELVLVNREHAYKDVPQQLIHIEKGSSDLIRVTEHMEMQPQVYKAMIDLAEAAVRDGISTLQLNSAYRSADHQAILYEQYGEDYALPANYSEHQTGLAIDIGVTTGKIEGTAAEKWLAKNAAAYGFVLRYPAHKVDVTNIAFEPWHFRYVGLPHSLIMQDEDLVLEEYLDYLQAQKVVEYKLGMHTYVVQYVKNDSTTELKVPSGQFSYATTANDDHTVVTTLLE